MDLHSPKASHLQDMEGWCVGKSGCIWIRLLVPRKPDLTSRNYKYWISKYLEEARSLSTSLICGTYTLATWDIKNVIKYQNRNHIKWKDTPQQPKTKKQKHKLHCHPKDVPSQLEVQHHPPDPTMPSHPELWQRQWRYRSQPLSPYQRIKKKERWKEIDDLQP